MGGLVFQSTTGGWTLGGVGYTLTLGGSGIDDTANTSGTTTINANLIMGANGAWSSGAGGNLLVSGTTTINATRVLTVNSGVVTLAKLDADSAARNFNKGGTGTLAITGAAGANLQGTFTLDGGTLILGNNTAMGTGALIFRQGTLQASQDLVIANNLRFGETVGTGSIAGSGNITFTNAFSSNYFAGRTLTSSLDSGKLLTFSGNFYLAETNTTARSQTIAGTGNTLISGNITNNSGTGGVGGLTITNNGTTRLSGTNSYTGATLVSAGTLIVTGGQTGATGNITVSGGATLAGTATMGNATTNLTTSDSTSVLAPGDGGVGKLSIGGAGNFASGATFKMELGTAATAGTTYDQLAIGGLLTGSTAAGNMKFDFTNLGSAQAGTPYKVLTFGSVSGFTVADLAMINSPGFTLDTGFNGSGWKINGTDLEVQFSAVPEPATWALLAFSLTTVMVLRRRRTRL